MKLYLFLFSALLFIGCTEPAEEIVVDDTPEVPVDRVLTKNEILRHIEAQLKIPGTEKYDYKIFKDQLTPDDSLDYIITVNLLQRAKEDAIKSGKTAKRAEIGYMGNFNYFFFMDGATGVITSPIAVPSSPLAELNVSFENITTAANKDILIDLRIGNAKFRKFYTISHNAPFQTCETELFTELGTELEQTFSVDYEEGTHSLAKNILIYEGEIEPLGEYDDIYNVDPKINATDKLVRRWYYSPQHMKYYLKKDEI